MRKVIMWNLVTLDGYFEGAKPWEIDWHEHVWGEDLERFSLEQAKEVGSLLFGRKTYEGMASYWPSAHGDVAEFMNSIPKVVFSNTLENPTWNNTRLVKGSAEKEVSLLRQESGKDLFIFGSANLCDSLTKQKLIDEYRIGLTPIVLGGGAPMFQPNGEQIRLRLLESRPVQTGAVLLRYARA